MVSTSALRTVTWRQATAAAVAVALALVGSILVFRSDGLPAVDAASSRATRWFVHEPSGRVVLVDGFGGRALASLDLANDNAQSFVAEGAGQAFVLDDSSREVRSIDSADLRLGPSQLLGALGGGFGSARSGSSGLLVADPLAGEATFVPTGGDAVDFDFPTDVGPGDDPAASVSLAPDGSVWSLSGGSLVRSFAEAESEQRLGLENAVLSLVGSEPFVLDRDGERVRLADGDWIDLPADIDPARAIIQQPGPLAECGWIASDDALACVGPDEIVQRIEIADLDARAGDLLAVAGDAGALIRRAPSEVVQFDWRGAAILDRAPVTVDADADLAVTATTDVIWIDDRSGDFVWTVHPWGIEGVRKNDVSALEIGEDGEITDDGDGDSTDTGTPDDGASAEPEEREPDDNGIDDPPVAVDDPVTARSGASVPVAVTANDYDPDGEAIAVSAVGRPGHGSAEVGTASTVVYTPEPGFVGIDDFEYTIVDGDGTEATATVIVELLPIDGTNRPPVGAPDRAETGPEVPVTVDVLLNDIDPERDGLRIASFSANPETGVVNETEGPSGVPALEYRPAPGFEGTAEFSYQPADSFGAVGEAVTVTVEVARPGDENRPPVVQPDSIRVRRNMRDSVFVLLNDSDPDGDVLSLSIVEPLPASIDVDVEGDHLAVTPLAGSPDSITFQYEVDDGQGNQVTGAVLVNVVDESDPNRPPVVSPDIETAVVGQTILIDVTANDTDPDQDPLRVIAASQPVDGGGVVSLGGNNLVQFVPSAIDVDEDAGSNVRFTYTVSDGNDHEVVGDVTVTVLAEPLPAPPFARDDSSFTFVDEAVTIDVLRNDGDPSGERPTIVGTPGCPAGGRATVTADSQVRFDPPAGQSGAFRCTYEVTNSQGLTDDAAILISVREREDTNEAPVAVNDLRTVAIGERIDIVVLANDSDADGPNSDLEVVSSTTTPLRNGDPRRERHLVHLDDTDRCGDLLVPGGRRRRRPRDRARAGHGHRRSQRGPDRSGRLPRRQTARPGPEHRRPPERQRPRRHRGRAAGRPGHAHRW